VNDISQRRCSRNRRRHNEVISLRVLQAPESRRIPRPVAAERRVFCFDCPPTRIVLPFGKSWIPCEQGFPAV